MQPLQIAIEGNDAVDAAKALMALSSLSGTIQTPAGTRREVNLSAVATIIKIIGTTLDAAKQIKKWYEKRKKANSGRTITKAVLVGNGKRVLLEGATVEDIKAVLESL